MKRCENKAEWPQNLVFNIFGRDTLEGCRLSPDWRGSLEYVLISMIPDDEELALRCRYQEGLTYQEIGERLGADKEVAKRKIATELTGADLLMIIAREVNAACSRARPSS